MIAIWWLSRGEAVMRFCEVLPILLWIWNEEEHALFKTATSFKFHFMLYLLADVLFVLNNLSMKFQDRTVDLTTVAATVDDACSALKQRYVTPVGRFGEFKQSRLAPFLKKHASTEKRVLVIEGVDAEGNTVMDTVPLHDEPIGKGALYGTSPEECYDLAKVFAQGLIDALDSRLDDLKMVDGANLFRPKKYPLLHTGKREKYWSDNLDLLFKLFDYKLPGVGKDACDADIGMLTNTLLKRHEN
ncbi:hypothetical protein CLOM_g9484 [Closterium sp. NIES-68]|nr:hypothetical protein CLOM_g9484 [Closterium sp. NIES-68]GJP84874.1 hypothetical protein CLOP_g14920 [Closterium sp. NIES-67]